MSNGGRLRRRCDEAISLALSDGVRVTRVRDNGTVFMRGTRFHVSRTLFGTLAYLVETEASLMVFDDQGTLLIERPWPEPGTKYDGSGRPRGRQPRTL